MLQESNKILKSWKCKTNLSNPGNLRNSKSKGNSKLRPWRQFGDPGRSGGGIGALSNPVCLRELRNYRQSGPFLAFLTPLLWLQWLPWLRCKIGIMSDPYRNLGPFEFPTWPILDVCQVTVMFGGDRHVRR